MSNKLLILQDSFGRVNLMAWKETMRQTESQEFVKEANYPGILFINF